MGKQSSSKKVARAARAGGRVSARRPRGLLFPGVLTLIVILGVALVVYVRNDRLQDDLGGVPQLEDHIHQAISINICGEEQPVVPEWEPSPTGLHTHGDGVMHIHPFSQLATGSNATLGRFIKSAKDEGGQDLSLSDTELTYLGETYEEGKAKCEGVEDPQLRMAYWENVGDQAAVPEVTTGAFTDRRLNQNGAGITIFYGDPDADIPRPPNAAQLAELGAADGGDAITTTTAAEGASTTTTAAGGVTTSTPAEGSTTTAPPTTTSTTAAP